MKGFERPLASFEVIKHYSGSVRVVFCNFALLKLLVITTKIKINCFKFMKINSAKKYI